MPAVRPFRESDTPQVANLHRRLFETAAASSLALDTAYQRYFKIIFLENPRANPAIPSLVFEETGGAITGFLGVTPQPMLFRDQPVMAAVGSQLIVDPKRRSTLAGVRLLKAFLSGPQDLSLADEASEDSRKLWQALGGSTAIPQSIHWLKVFRPGEFLLSWMSGYTSKRHNLAWTAALAGPVGRVGDAVAGAIRGKRFSAPPKFRALEEPAVEVLLSCLTELTRNRPLRPAYDQRSLSWQLEVLERHIEKGSLRKGIVRNAKSKVVGWYLYHAKQNGVGEVLQLGAAPNWQDEVLNHLFFDAWKHRVTALCGRLEPEFMDEMRKKQCLLYNRGYWMLVHSRNSAILQTIRCGDAFVSRLEGEYLSHFGSETAFAVPGGGPEDLWGSQLIREPIESHDCHAA